MATCPLTREEILDMILANLPEDKHIVGAASNNSGTTLTRNDGVTFNIPVPQGDLLETPDEFIITFNGETITIPKCLNYFYDCDNEPIDNCRDRIVTCENLDDRDYITYVVTEDVIAGDGRPGNPVRFNCAAAELIDDPDNHQVLLCGPNGVKKIDPGDLLSEVCLSEPTRFDGCGTNEQVVMQRDANGCWRLGIMSTQAKRTYRADAGNGGVNKPLNGSYVWPTEFASPATIDQLRAADNHGTGTIPEALIQDNIVANVSMTLPCRTLFSITNRIGVSGSLTLEQAYTASASLSYRYRVDGGAWIYPRVNSATEGNNLISFARSFNALDRNYSLDWLLTLPAGDIEWQMIVASNSTTNVSPIVVSTYTDETGIASSPSANFTPVIN